MMNQETAFSENHREVGKQYGGNSKMQATDQKPVAVSLTREEEIEQIVASDYRRHRLGDLEVYLCSPEKISDMADAGHPALTVDSQAELKKDVAEALRQFSPAERRIIHRVFVQGQSIDLATKGSKYSTAYWTHRFRTHITPKLREALGDYFVNGKVVL